MSGPTVGEVLRDAGLLLAGFVVAIAAVELLAALYMEFI